MQSHSFLFPKLYHEPPLDWDALKRCLLDDGVILPAKGEDVARDDIRDLAHCLRHTGFFPGEALEWMRSPRDLVEFFKANGALPASVAVDANLGMAETIAILQELGIQVDRCWRSIEAQRSNTSGTRYVLGPRARSFFADDFAWEDARRNVALSLLQFHKRPFLSMGRNLKPPMIPGSNQVLTELQPYGCHRKFIRAASADSRTTWMDPRTQEVHHILDLDWQGTFGIGHQTVMIEGDGGGGFPKRLADFLAEVIGEPMIVATRDLL
jgi:hypothetical protein